MAEWWCKVPCVYIMASARDGVIYTGVTSNLFQRVSIHKQDLIEGFTNKYRVHTLVYYQLHETMEQAIAQETRFKNWHRAWKVRRIEEMNPEWIDLFDERTGSILPGPADEARFRR